MCLKVAPWAIRLQCPDLPVKWVFGNRNFLEEQEGQGGVIRLLWYRSAILNRRLQGCHHYETVAQGHDGIQWGHVGVVLWQRGYHQSPWCSNNAFFLREIGSVLSWTRGKSVTWILGVPDCVCLDKRQHFSYSSCRGHHKGEVLQLGVQKEGG